MYNIDGFRNNPTLGVDNRYLFFNPKAGLTYRKGWYTAFASFAVANKEPNRDDFEAGAEQQPQHERLYDTELGISYGGKKIKWSASFYNMQYRNQLVLTGRVNDVGAYTRTNAPNSFRRGVELEGTLTYNQWLEVGANLTLSRNRILNFTEFIDDFDGGGQKAIPLGNTALSFSPAIISGGNVVIKGKKSWTITLLPKYIGKQYLDNTQNESRKLPGYFVQDVVGSYSINRWGLKETLFTVAVYNAFNNTYESNGYTFSYLANGMLNTENFYYPMAGINAMVGLTIKL